MKHKDKCFYFPFYPDEWLGSPKVMLMTPAEEGAYIRLLAISWGNENCSLPDDDNELSILSRLGQEWFNGSGQKIRQNFTKNGTTIYNQKLRQVKIKSKKMVFARKKAGMAGAKKRWENKDIDSVAMANASQTEGEPIAFKVKVKVKEKESNKEKEKNTPPTDLFFSCEYFSIGTEKVDDYCTIFNVTREVIKSQLLLMKIYLQEHPDRRYKDYPAFIRNWLKRSFKNQPTINGRMDHGDAEAKRKELDDYFDRTFEGATSK